MQPPLMIASRAEEVWECKHWSSDQKVFGYRSNMVRILGRMRRGSIDPIWLKYWVG